MEKKGQAMLERQAMLKRPNTHYLGEGEETITCYMGEEQAMLKQPLTN